MGKLQFNWTNLINTVIIRNVQLILRKHAILQLAISRQHRASYIHRPSTSLTIHSLAIKISNGKPNCNCTQFVSPLLCGIWIVCGFVLVHLRNNFDGRTHTKASTRSMQHTYLRHNVAFMNYAWSEYGCTLLPSPPYFSVVAATVVVVADATPILSTCYSLACTFNDIVKRANTLILNALINEYMYSLCLRRCCSFSTPANREVYKWQNVISTMKDVMLHRYHTHTHKRSLTPTDAPIAHRTQRRIR